MANRTNVKSRLAMGLQVVLRRILFENDVGN